MSKPKTPDPHSIMGDNGTWLEPESLCYPNGGMTRRCRALHEKTRCLMIVRCGIPDSYFSIPAKGGWVSYDYGTFNFHPNKGGDQHAG